MEQVGSDDADDRLQPTDPFGYSGAPDSSGSGPARSGRSLRHFVDICVSPIVEKTPRQRLEHPQRFQKRFTFCEPRDA